jgi:hypothetical protein
MGLKVFQEGTLSKGKKVMQQKKEETLFDSPDDSVGHTTHREKLKHPHTKLLEVNSELSIGTRYVSKIQKLAFCALAMSSSK